MRVLGGGGFGSQLFYLTEPKRRTEYEEPRMK
jgi:hypothetical protein